MLDVRLLCSRTRSKQLRLSVVGYAAMECSVFCVVPLHLYPCLFGILVLGRPMHDPVLTYPAEVVALY